MAGKEITLSSASPATGSMAPSAASSLARSGELLRVGLAESSLHALIERLRTVLRHARSAKTGRSGSPALGAGIRAAGDDAGADDVLGVGHLDLARHVGARGETRDGGGGRVGAELRQLIRRRRGRERRRKRATAGASAAGGGERSPSCSDPPQRCSMTGRVERDAASVPPKAS